MSEGVWQAVVTLAFTILFGWLLVAGFKNGTMEFPQPAFTMSGRRHDQPVRFWLTASFIALLTAVCAVMTIRLAFFPRGF
ncbi:hypothetical protein BWQ93_03170 [Sphingopyxis sp. QXT-31]|nr:hypothetical protein BWQ93_03170 [Sphingopyxis sp. QXT-31]